VAVVLVAQAIGRMVRMVIYTEKGEDCSRMSLEEFKNKVLQHVRKSNYLDLVESWESHVIYKEYQESNVCGTSYYGTVFFADETHKSEPVIRIYQFSYHENSDNTAFFYYGDSSIYKEEIEAINKFLQCFNANKGRYINCALDDFHIARP